MEDERNDPSLLELALSLLDAAKTSDLQWRLARREAYNSLSDLTLATQRSMAEPVNVRPPLEPLEALQARSYQLLAQLTAVKSMLLLRRGQLDMAVAKPALAQASQCIAAELAGSSTEPPQFSANPSSPSPDPLRPAPDPVATGDSSDTAFIAGQPFQPRPDPLLANDLTPWLLRRLALASSMAQELRRAVARALG